MPTIPLHSTERGAAPSRHGGARARRAGAVGAGALLALVTTVALPGVASAQMAQVTFAAAQLVDLGGDLPNSVVAADLNADGALDLATANFGSDDVSVLRGDGAGGFAAAQLVGLGGGVDPLSVVAADLDGDGALDLVTANAGTDDLSVLLGDGAGGFAAAQNVGVGGDAPNTVVAADLNGDGDLDLATANLVSVSVLLGDGAGGFAAAQTLGVGGGASPRSVVAADLDGDGALDLVTGNRDSDDVSVLRGDGAGGFAAAQLVGLGGGDAPLSVVAADLDGDGALDLVTANSGSDDVSVLRGDGAGRFAAAQLVGLGGGDLPASVVAADLDGDGALDLVTANFGSDDVSVLRGDGARGFAAAQLVGLGGGDGPRSVVAADLNGDAALDLATANRTTFDVSVLVQVVDRAPVANPDTYSTTQNTPLPVPAPGVLGNDTDAEAGPLSAALGTGPANGTVALSPDGSFSYTPQAGFVGADTFTYTASDGTATSQPATVTIDVTAATCGIAPPPGSIVGTGRNDTLNGTAGDDLIYGLDGNDTINGRGGNDLVCGGPGNDTIFGGDGDDRLSGEAGNDLVQGNDGDDTLSGGDGNDSLNGGAGTNTVDGGAGNDACRNPATGPGCP